MLLTGPSGAGKSDLALRLIASGWRLVADDYTHVWASGGGLYATAPERISGRIEARGLGILPAATLSVSRIVLVANGLQTPAQRLPEPGFQTLHGVRLPCLDLDIRPASAATLVALAIDRL